MQDTKKFEKGIGPPAFPDGIGPLAFPDGIGPLAFPDGIWPLAFPDGIGPPAFPFRCRRGGCCAVESSTRAAPPDECHDRKINIESQTVQQIGNETYVWRGLVLLIPLTIEGLDQNTLSNCDCCSQSVGGIAQWCTKVRQM